MDLTTFNWTFATIDAPTPDKTGPYLIYSLSGGLSFEVAHYNASSNKWFNTSFYHIRMTPIRWIYLGK